MEETTLPAYFGEWLKHRRKQLDLTQAELARRASCSLPGLRKIEAGERRPSKQLAGLLAKALEVSPEDQTTFMKVARGELNVERLPMPGSVRAADRVTDQEASSIGVNLPFQPTSFIGRETELAALGKLLADPQCRLLTITGMGGIGKTRLAIEAAYAAQNHFPDGVMFVALAALTSSTSIVSAISDALNLNLAGSEDPRKQLFNALRGKKLLLVLDNAEHLLNEVELFTKMLESGPSVKLLVTSLECLNLQGEWVFNIQGLPMPKDDQEEQIERYSSIALFIQRARHVKVDYELDHQEQPWVVRICRMVEGMPLGIELAAAWVGVLSCAEIAREIEANLDFLAANMRDMPQRQRSLRATFNHSWKLLSSDEQTVFKKLAVFRGGFTRQAAEQVVEASLPLLSSLMTKSLIYRKSDTHFDMHPLVHQYATDKLQEDASLHVFALERHRQYFMDFLIHLHPEVHSPDRRSALKTIQADLDNVREAWQRTVVECRFNGLRQAEKCLYDFFDLRDRMVEGYAIITFAAEGLRAELIKHPDNNIELLTLMGLLLIDQSYFGFAFLRQGEVIDLARKGYEFLRDGNDPTAFGYAALWLAVLDNNAGNLVNAESHVRESLVIFRGCGDEQGVAAALGIQASLALALRRFEEGFQVAMQAETIYLRYGNDESLYRILIFRGELALHTGQYDQAKMLFNKALALSKSTGLSAQIGLALCMLARLALDQNDLQEARRLADESLLFLSKHDALTTQSLGFRHFGNILSVQGEFKEARSWLCKSLRPLVLLEFISPALDVLLDYARLCSRQGYLQQALGLVFFLISEPRVRPLTKYYADQVCAELLPRLTAEQTRAAREYAQNQAFEAIVSEILQSSDAGEGP